MKINNETKIGLMLFVVICVLAGLTIKTGNFNLSREGYIVKVRFYNIDGINLNSPVMLNGFEIGIVEGVDILDDGLKTLMELQCWVKGDVRLRAGVKVFVKNLGFMGEKYIGFVSGKATGDYLKDGAIVAGEEPVDFSDLLRDGQEISENIKNISLRVDDRLEKNQKNIDNILTHTSSTMENISSITQRVDTRLKKNEDHVDGIVYSLKSAAGNLDELTCDLKNNPWKLTYREKSSRKKCDEGK